jgi:short-subunit dehydrogenase
MAQWALVTGATVGIGESFTRLLASKGYNVVLVARDESRLHERATGLREKYGVQTFVLPADLSTDAGCASVEDYIKTYEIEVLINNAGFGLNKAFSASELAAEQQMFDVLVRTPMRLMHTVIPGMKQRNSGTIINVSSVASFIAGGTYSASKSYHQRGRMKMKGLPAFMWLNADKLVEQSWKDAQANKPVSIPGWQYKLLVAIISIAPRKFVRQIGMNVRKKQR